MLNTSDSPSTEEVLAEAQLDAATAQLSNSEQPPPVAGNLHSLKAESAHTAFIPAGLPTSGRIEPAAMAAPSAQGILFADGDSAPAGNFHASGSYEAAALSGVLPEPSNDRSEKADQVQRMFDRIAGRYDVLNDWISMGFHRQWKQKACERLHLEKGMAVLDVCTGTGDLVQYLNERVGSNGHVEGLDFSANMLAQARLRYVEASHITFTQGDALNLPYPDNSFDGVVISFGLRNVTDIPRALREMYRVIKPGGWMVNLDTSPKPKLPGMRFYFSKIMPLMGHLLGKDEQAYRYLSESTRHFLTPDELLEVFSGAGCVNVSSDTLMLGSVSLQAGQKAPV